MEVIRIKLVEWGRISAVIIDDPIKAINKLSKELEKRDRLIPADIILDTIVEDRADIPINAIHTVQWPQSGFVSSAGRG